MVLGPRWPTSCSEMSGHRAQKVLRFAAYPRSCRSPAVPLIGYRVTHRNSRRTASAPPEPEQIPPLVAIEKNVAGTFALSHRFCDSASLSRRCLLYTSDAADDLLCVDLG